MVVAGGNKRTSRKFFLLGCGTGAILVVILLVTVLVGGALFFKEQLVAHKTARLKAPPIPSDAPAVYDWSVLDVNGEQLHLASLAGRTVFLTFWSPDCIPCLAQLPSLQRLYEKTRHHVEFVSVVSEKGESLESALETHEVTFPIFTLDGEKPELFDGTTSPTTFILSPEGGVAFTQVGAANWDDERCVLFLERLSLSNVSEAGSAVED